MKKRSIIKTFSRSLQNKTILERSGISARAYLSKTKAHTLAIFPDTLKAAEFLQDYKNLYPELNILMLNEMPLTSNNQNSKALLLERGETIKRWINENGILVSVPAALMTPCMIGNGELKIKLHDKIGIDEIKSWLEKSGYKRSNLVWLPGQYIQRGFILDVFDPAYAMPLRFEFFDEEIERIGAFQPDTQKSAPDLMAIDETVLHGIYDAELRQPVELLPEDTMVILNEPEKIEAQADSFIWLWNEIYSELKADSEIDLWNKVFHELATYPILRISSDPLKSDVEAPTEGLPAFRGSAESILKMCKDLERSNFEIEVFTTNPVFQKLPYKIQNRVLSSGFIDKNSKRAFISDRELSGINANVSLTQWKAPNEWKDIEKLSPGQLVIHDDYGTGIFRGIETINASGVQMDMLAIEFADDQRLLIPVLQSEKITGLNEHENEITKLDTLKGKSWKKNLQKTQEKAREEAKILMDIFAHRELERREPFEEPDEAYEDFVKSFQYNETADQLKAIDEIMKDLSSNYPMDRLLVGDVGFGKTEVALRAAFRVVMSGFQVCVLVPTTILAQQHFATFQSRLSGFPIKVGLLSRFITPKQSKEIIKSTSEGKIDILIGTHKLLQKGINFQNLGLLIIDEEHRFGVMHKEGLKKTYGSVDILSLSATPIPRTLAMSLRGLRTISVLSTPPENRLPVATFTGKWNPGTIRRAITYELNRGGQVYFLSNKISRMPDYEKMLTAFFPDAAIQKAHGQMPEKELEQTMLKFYDGKIDILLATTIIESGLDVGRANTIIIDNAEELGLAQMYQLRGRVGRRGEKAFAYFFYPDKISLNRDTMDRIEAIGTMTDLGSGYEIARRDLDIRGGGDIGGTTQHGNTKSGNYHIFYKMLEEELNRLRGISERKDIEITSDRGNGYIPEDYIPQDDVRITIYRRIINSRNLEELEKLISEINDRFGKIPSELEYLTGLTAVRNFGSEYGIENVEIKKGFVKVKHKGLEISAIMRTNLKKLGRNVKYLAIS